MSRAAAAGLAAFSVLVCASPLVDPDLWWHLAAARDMLAAGAVPRAEGWSWTLAGAPWTDFEWLAQLGLWGVHRAAGFPGLVLLKAAACALTALLVFLWARREDASVPAALLAALLALSALRLRAHARPELVTLVLLPLFLWAARERLRRPAALWPLAVLAWLWANAHGAWPLGPGVLLLAALGRAWETRGLSDPAARALALCAGACAAVSVLNPYGLGAHAVLLRHLLHPPAAAGIEEWMSDGLTHFPAFWLLLAGAAARLGLDLRLGRRESLVWVCLLAPLALLGLGGARFAPLFCLAAAPFVLSRTAGLPASPALRWGPPAACAALALALLVPVRHRRWGEPVRWELFPRGAVEFLAREGVEGPLFNDYGWGGYIAWAGAGRFRTYYDGRYLFQGLIGREDPAGAGAAVLRHRPFADRAGWALVWFDDAAAVYLSRSPENAGRIARLELRHADPGDPAAMLERVRRGESPRAAVLAELGRHPGAVSDALSRLVAAP